MNTVKQTGFTLIEVMIVAAIIAILAAIAYPSYRDSIIKTKRAEARAALYQAMQQQERFYTQNNRYSLGTNATTDPPIFNAYSGENLSNSAYQIKAIACGASINDCVQMVATPGKKTETFAGDKNFDDPKCDNLMLTSTGVRTSEPASNLSICWP